MSDPIAVFRAMQIPFGQSQLLLQTQTLRRLHSLCPLTFHCRSTRKKVNT